MSAEPFNLEDYYRKIAREEALKVLAELGRTAAPTSPDEDRGLSAEEAARLLGVKKWRIYEMVKRRALRAYRPSPGTVRIPMSAIAEFKQREGGEP